MGENKHLYKKSVVVSQLNFIPRSDLSDSTSVTAKIRYKHKQAGALLSPLEKNRARLKFDTPQRAVTPGQSAVFYDNELVWGGGIIERTEA